jgi:malonyl-CoA/methylmalonyl-CoA synthetase
VVVCSPKNHGWVSKIAFSGRHAPCVHPGRRRATAACWSAPPTTATCISPQCGADDLAVIIYTSGTTGRSKGAMLARQHAEQRQVLRSYWDWQPDDVLIHALPIFHVHGLFVAIHAALINGSPMLWLNKFDPPTVVSLLPRATVFMGVPTLYVRMLAEPA